MSDEIYLTEEGAHRMRKELQELTGPKRIDLAKRLRVAIQQGDLSENADYIATKEEQGFLEGRIQDLEHILKAAIIVEENHEKHDQVEIGARVTIQEDDLPPETFMVVGVSEADPRKGRISHESPIGQALFGHRTGDEVTAEAPNGSIQIKILDIE
jgi:transcription elongation factor GreA